MKTERYLSPAAVGELLGFSPRTIADWARPRDGRAGVFGDGVLWVAFPSASSRPAESRPTRGPVRDGVWRIPESAVQRFLANSRVVSGLKGGNEP